MKEFRIPESTIRRILRLTFILLTTILVTFMCFVILDQLNNGYDVKAILFTTGFTLLGLSVPMYCGVKRVEKRLRDTKLIIYEDFLIWISPNNGAYKIMYCDIKQIMMKKSKGIVLKLKHSFKRIQIVKSIEDIENIYLLLQKEIGKNTN